MQETKDFTEQDVVDYLKDNGLITKSRKRTIVDPRNFLINILCYKFSWIEERVGLLIEKDRSSVNHCRDNAYYLKNDACYLKNTIDVRNRFSTWSPDYKERIIREDDFLRKRPVTMQLNKAEYEKLEAYRETLRLSTIGGAARVFLFSNIHKII
jgi:hypothetical protein